MTVVTVVIVTVVLVTVIVAVVTLVIFEILNLQTLHDRREKLLLKFGRKCLTLPQTKELFSGKKQEGS